MKKTLTEWIDEDNNVIFKETILECELPRKGEFVIWMKMHFEITSIERNFDQKKNVVMLKRL